MTRLLTTLALLALTATAPLFAQSDLKEQLVVPLTDPGKPGSMEVTLINGSIHVVGYSGKDIVIDATSGTAGRAASGKNRQGQNERLNENLNMNLNVNVNTNRRDDGRLSEGMRRITPNSAFDLTAEEKNNAVKVNSGSLQKAVNLTIKVPQRFSLKLHTINNGDITVENVTGELEISNINGAIELTNISGSAVAQTVNGDLKAIFRDVDNKTPMAFSTLNGKVDVTFPASVKANVKLKSDMGDVYSDFDIDVDKSQPKATRSNQSGMYRVTVDDWVYGKINNGGPEVMMKTMQGSIYVRKAK
ncbi:DUF4097 family beta strand repeat-containing protein [Fibrivirga algicola]|uniref:DUF4097 domain-containing protein n=1 Tax=Fibrivirga algicola TaxID=2950420 RepID=A0ABX0QEL4_9BACT|nr:DUF4097 family beta strand repeat-containing protein [Fibrivirga algicola]NID09660.1 DUF4097 domain-containing protein [Fibrivirga algicola]